MKEQTLHNGKARLIYGTPNIESLRSLPTDSVNCVVTSPPYWGLRDYGAEGQLGLEGSPADFVAGMVEVFEEVRRVLHPSGTLWLNLGDSYNSLMSGSQNLANSSCSVRGGGHKASSQSYSLKRGKSPGLKPKDLVGIPWRVALALQNAGWWLRQDIIWHKPNPMPTSASDRCTTAHEYIFLLTKSAQYDFSQMLETATSGQGEATKRNKRSVWTIASQPYPGSHFAVFPEELARLCITAGCPEGGTVLDPFSGSGTAGKVALQLGRKYIGLDVNEEYLALALRRVDHYQSDTPSESEKQGQASLFDGLDRQ
tara:strand:+ start:285 stop:1220 length:936 start_codon:yes stop_codon:yes gene_type:complete